MALDHKKVRCLITGSNGFIGSALKRVLLQQGHKVICLPRNWKKIPKVDYIFHLAAYGNLNTHTDEQEIFQANVINTWNILNATKGMKYKAFINVGSSSEYGKKDAPMKEKDLPEGETFYACTKIAGTYLSRACAIQWDKPIVTVRPFSVYGPGDKPEKFISLLVKTAKQGGLLSVAPGVHDWIYIDDFISGLITVAKNADQLKGEVINIGTGLQHTNLSLVGIIREISMKPIKVSHMGSIREFDSDKRWMADITKLKVLGWKPLVDLEQGLGRLYYGN